jgi:hypothetical protein
MPCSESHDSNADLAQTAIPRAFQIEDTEDCTLQLDLTPIKEGKSKAFANIKSWQKGKGRQHQAVLELAATGRELHSDSKVERERRRGEDTDEGEERVRGARSHTLFRRVSEYLRDSLVFSKNIGGEGHSTIMILHFWSRSITDVSSPSFNPPLSLEACGRPVGTLTLYYYDGRIQTASFKLSNRRMTIYSRKIVSMINLQGQKLSSTLQLK